MFQKPLTDIQPNTTAFETLPLLKPTSFREYKARWWFGHPGSDKPPELNLAGVQTLGLEMVAFTDHAPQRRGR